MWPTLLLVALQLATSAAVQSSSHHTGALTSAIIDADITLRDTGAATGCSETKDTVSRGYTPSLQESPSLSTVIHRPEENNHPSEKLFDSFAINVPVPKIDGIHISEENHGIPVQRSMNLNSPKQQSSNVRVREMSTARKVIGAIAVGVLVMVV